jgi:hypothetical protein
MNHLYRSDPSEEGGAVGVSDGNTGFPDLYPAFFYRIYFIERDDIGFVYADEICGRQSFLHAFEILKAHNEASGGDDGDILLSCFQVLDAVQRHPLDLVRRFDKERSGFRDLLENFRENADRKAIWVNSIRVSL